MGIFLEYEYTFPTVKVEGKVGPKYAVRQIEDEIFNWGWDDKISTYCTNTRHPELEGKKDVKFRELKEEVHKVKYSKKNLMDRSKKDLDLIAKKYGIKGAKNIKKEDLIPKIIKAQAE